MQLVGLMPSSKQYQLPWMSQSLQASSTRPLASIGSVLRSVLLHVVVLPPPPCVPLVPPVARPPLAVSPPRPAFVPLPPPESAPPSSAPPALLELPHARGARVDRSHKTGRERRDTIVTAP